MNTEHPLLFALGIVIFLVVLCIAAIIIDAYRYVRRIKKLQAAYGKYPWSEE